MSFNDADNQSLLQAGLFSQHRPQDGRFDEVMAAPGNYRPHWRPLVDSLEMTGVKNLAARADIARKSLRRNGVTYNVYGDPKGADRPWEYDLLPLVIPADEWAALEKGLVQRSRLINALLADCYGPRQQLLSEKLPPALVLANPGFQRVCDGTKPPGGTWLHLHSVDLARAPDGKWWALGDRAHQPSGAGYALENRMITNRALPGEFQSAQVQRLAGFFKAFRANLIRLALPLAQSGEPRVVLLTSGPLSETYFEHAYLARYLGFTLVQGNDLTVRGCKVFLKTLEGLQPVHAIVRRLDDQFSDPLELRSDSFLGVTGLCEAARQGNVVVANGIGSALAESAAWLAFFPTLCKALLGEELLLPSVATWWCGQEKEREHVLNNLELYVIKGAYPDKPMNPWFGNLMSEAQKATLRAAVRARPNDYVAQELLKVSRVPVLMNNRLEWRPVALRVYIAATGDGEYSVMPGGLARVSAQPDVPIVSMQNGGVSKDTWVISPGPVDTTSLLKPRLEIVRVSKNATGLPSRIAEELFWLGRNAETLEGHVRLYRCVLHRAEGGDAPATPGGVNAELTRGPLTRWLRRAKVLPEKASILDAAFTLGVDGGIQGQIARLKDASWRTRDRFSMETTRILNELKTLYPKEPPELSHQSPRQGILALDRALVRLSAFSGLEMENMTRGHSWLFLDMGRRIGRSAHMLGILAAAVGPDIESLLDPLLEAADSMMTYQRTYYSAAQPAAVYDLLLLSDTNPRALYFQLETIEEHLQQLPPLEGGPPLSAELIKARELLGRVSQWDLTRFFTIPTAAATLKTELLRLRGDLFEFSNMLTARWFSHATEHTNY